MSGALGWGRGVLVGCWGVPVGCWSSSNRAEAAPAIGSQHLWVQVAGHSLCVHHPLLRLILGAALPYFGHMLEVFLLAGGCGGFCSLSGCPCPAGLPPGWGLCSARRPGSRQLGRDPAACHARKIPDNTILQAVCPKKGATACFFFWLSAPLASPSHRGAQGRCLSTARLDVALAPSR